MRLPQRSYSAYFPFCVILWVCTAVAFAQSGGSSGTITGTVVDPTAAAVAGANVVLQNTVSGVSRSTQADATGQYRFTNIPFNPYHVIVTSPGFSTSDQRVEVRSGVVVTLKTVLAVAAAGDEVTVEASGGDLVENSATFHVDIDRELFTKLPLESQSSSVSSLLTLASPGVSADSNGLFHGLGDHAENAFYVDGQPVTDQQSKVFSNQLPLSAIQSLEVISGAPPAEYGEKTSLVIVAHHPLRRRRRQPKGGSSALTGVSGPARSRPTSPRRHEATATSSPRTSSTPAAFSTRRSSS